LSCCLVTGVEPGEIDQLDVGPRAGGLAQFVHETGAGEQQQPGLRRVVTSLGQQSPDPFQPVEISKGLRPVCGFCLPDCPDDGALGVSLLAVSQRDDVYLVGGPASRVVEHGLAYDAHWAAECRGGKSAGPFSAEILDVQAEHPARERLGGGRPRSRSAPLLIHRLAWPDDQHAEPDDRIRHRVDRPALNENVLGPADETASPQHLQWVPEAASVRPKAAAIAPGVVCPPAIAARTDW
jgi:hypothetical protein